MHPTDQLNTALTGRYAIDRLIGEGGMATVYLARDVKHNRKVALKVLKPDLGAIVGVERFLSEIQVTANLQHPNLLPLFDSGAADGLLFYVMPYVEGESLRVRIQREKQLPVEEAVRLATAIASALDYAHRHGVIHRDLKPENILLHEGQPLVADFGIALAVSNAGGNRITQTGLSLGTPQYMSPEQATGDRVIDARTDIYSLGAVAYEMLTGEPPHVGSTSQAVIARVLTERPRSIRTSRPNVPEQVEAAVDRALEKLPADRWATARELSEALTGARIVTRSTSGTHVKGRAAARRPALREIAAWAIAVAAVAGLAFVALRPKPAAVPGVVTEFELELPDSLDVSPRGSVAGLALSRDGRVLVFQGTLPGEAPAMFIRRLEERDVQRIRGTDSSRAPSLSADGTELLFVTGGAAGGRSAGAVMLKRISTRGGAARTLLDSVGGAPAAWGESQLVFSIDSSIFIGSAEGGSRRLLARPDASRRHLRYGFPDVLPGARAGLITIWKGATLDSASLGVITIPEGRVTELEIRGVMARFSGTGHIVYATADGWLNAVPFDVKELRVTGASFPIAEDVRVGGGGAAAFAVSDNGTLAYITGGSVGDGRTLVIVNRSGIDRPLGRSGYYSGPRVSPDGRQIAVAAATASGVDFPNADIWRFDTASKVLQRVTTDSLSARPAWTRDGERISYTTRSGDTVLYARPLYAAGQSLAVARAPLRIVDVSWGPAHGYSALKVRDGTNKSDDIWLVHNDSLDKPRPWLVEPYEEQAPAVSPDGRYVAYLTNRTGRFEVYVRAIAGGAELQVSSESGYEPVWAPGGNELFYRFDWLWSVRINFAPLAIVRRDSLFREDAFPRNGEHANYDVFPDGQHFAMVGRARRAGPTTPPIIVRTNWHVRSSATQPER